MSLGLEPAGVVAKIGGELEGPAGQSPWEMKSLFMGASGPTPPVFFAAEQRVAKALDDVLSKRPSD